MKCKICNKEKELHEFSEMNDGYNVIIRDVCKNCERIEQIKNEQLKYNSRI